MPRRGDVFAKGHYYHIYNRGAGRSPIFYTDDQYDYCLDLAARYQKPYAVSTIAYCLSALPEGRRSMSPIEPPLPHNEQLTTDD